MHYRPKAERGDKFLKKRFIDQQPFLVVLLVVAGFIGLYCLYRFCIIPIVVCCERRAARKAAKNMTDKNQFANDAEMAAMAAAD